jgi:hypothetical protein
MGASRPLSTLVAAVAATLLTAGLTPSPASAVPNYDQQPTHIGSGWLSKQLTGGLVHNEQFDFDDVGLSIDVALGLDAARRKAETVEAITKSVAKNVDFYTTSGFNVYAGATAKALLLAIKQGKNPHLFGGSDLLSRLEGRVSTTAPITGRIEDLFDPNDEFGADFANVIGQAYAAQALSLAKSPQAAPAVAFLLAQQCDKGYFRQSFTADKSRPDQSCQGAPKSERGASTDATAQAIIALQSVKGPVAKAAAAKAAAWLADTQLADGSFTDTGKPHGIANSNSTGLAGWALGTEGSAKAAARRAAVWVRNLQVPKPNPCAAKLVADVGAIAYDDDAYDKGQGSGITKKDSDQWRRASAQALPALRWAPKVQSGVQFSASAPATVKVGKTLDIRVSGVARGERVCVTGAGRTYEFPSGLKATTEVSFVASPGTGRRTYTVWLGDDSRRVSVRVTG